MGGRERDGVAKPGKISPRAYRNLNNKSDVQSSQDYRIRVSGRSDESVTL